MSDCSQAVLEQRIALAQAQLFRGPLYYAPIRHHSPACAFALQAMLRELRPQRVLIEGPASFDALLPLLTDPATQPPVAVLCGGSESGDGQARPGSYYPLCDYSPEWVALQTGRLLGAQLQFIDLDPSQRDLPDEDQAHSLLLERHLAHSDYLRRLASNAGCRDHDELWDHLFELRPAAQLRDWRALFGEVHAYCAHARLDYSKAELEAEGSAARERCMLRHMQQALAECDGPVVVVTGGFHTLGLIEAMASGASSKPSRSRASESAPAWLIRYSFDRLDALNGYAAGMPAPDWYQQVWEALQAEDDQPQRSAALATLTAFAHAQRGRSSDEGLSTADLQAALLQAERLAQLREHPGPGRMDLIDAAASCFIKGAIDEGGQALLRQLRQHLCGYRMGDVPASAGSPPLLQKARAEARALGLKLDDAAPRDTQLDLYRKPRHLARSRYFQRLSFLGVGLAEWRGGPDFVHATGLNLLHEHWRYAWTPAVEAQLIELSASGSDLQRLAVERLLAQEAELQAQGQGRSASKAVGLLIRACVMGLQEHCPRLLALISRQLAEDGEFASVVGCLSQLLNCSRGRRVLGLSERREPGELLAQAVDAALLLLPALAGTPAEQEGEQIAALLQLRACSQALQEEHASLGSPLQRLLAELSQTRTASGIAGAALAWRYLDGQVDDASLGLQLQRHFGMGAEPSAAVRFLNGLLRLAPELLLHSDALQLALDRCLQRWDETQFLQHLPDLRQSLSFLKPSETDALAGSVAARYGLRETLMQTHTELSAADLLEGTRLQAAMVRSLHDSGLSGWLAHD